MELAMQPFITHSGIVAPFDRANVDTDLIIPKQFLKSVKRTGFGVNLFDQLRYLDEGRPDMEHGSRPVNEDFVLNQKPYDKASILLARENFGCGSSREHAVWALLDFGFRLLLAPSFADIFAGNCLKNGILAVTLPAETVEELFQRVAKEPGYSLEADLPRQRLTTSDGLCLSFDIDPYRKDCLLGGLDDIGLTLEKTPLIEEYEQRAKKRYPWLFTDLA